MYVSLFVCMRGIFRPTREFSPHFETSLLPLKVVNFYLWSELMAIEQWGFFSVSHLLCHGASIHNGLCEDPWHSHIFPRSGAVTTWSNDLCLSRLGFEHPTCHLLGERWNPLRHRRGRHVRCKKVADVWVAGMLHSIKSIIIILAYYFYYITYSLVPGSSTHISSHFQSCFFYYE